MQQVAIAPLTNYNSIRSSDRSAYALPDEYGFGYVKAPAANYCGIPEVYQIQAVGLDLLGADEDEILKEAIGRIDRTVTKP